MDVPRHVGQTPVYYYQHVGCRSDAGMKSINPQGYCTISCASQLPFGYGLSYTKYAYDRGSMEINLAGEDGIPVIRISVKVSNDGAVEGDEVVQLYGIDRKASIMRPQRELLGFRRISLEPGETKTVEFIFRLDQLAFFDADGRWVLEAGDFDFFIGRDCNTPVFECSYRQRENIEIDHRTRGLFAETIVR